MRVPYVCFAPFQQQQPYWLKKTVYVLVYTRRAAHIRPGLMLFYADFLYIPGIKLYIFTINQLGLGPLCVGRCLWRGNKIFKNKTRGRRLVFWGSNKIFSFLFLPVYWQKENMERAVASSFCWVVGGRLVGARFHHQPTQWRAFSR